MEEEGLLEYYYILPCDNGPVLDDGYLMILET